MFSLNKNLKIHFYAISPESPILMLTNFKFNNLILGFTFQPPELGDDSCLLSVAAENFGKSRKNVRSFRHKNVSGKGSVVSK